MDSIGRSKPDRPRLNVDSPKVCVTLDLENDWYLDRPGYDHLTFQYIADYISLLTELDVPVSVFVVGKTLEKYPERVEQIRTKTESEFYLHSYSHDLSKSYDFAAEVSRGMDAFESFFGYRPIGYRAPQGNIEPAEIHHLGETGFQFDSSVFPSYRPGVYNNLDAPLGPYRPSGTEQLIEYPIGALPKLRVPFSQSYLKLVGRPYFWGLSRLSLPDILVFDSHLQDFYRTASHDQLETPMRQIHKRNLSNSTDLFRRLVTLLRNRGYEFVLMSDVHEQLEKT